MDHSVAVDSMDFGFFDVVYDNDLLPQNLVGRVVPF